MNLATLKKAIESPKRYEKSLRKVMDEHPEVLFGCVNELGSIPFTKHFAEEYAEWMNGMTRWGCVSTNTIIQTMNRGAFKWWMPDKWGGDTPSKGVGLNGQGLMLADRFPRGKSTHMATYFAGFDGIEDMKAAAKNPRGISDITEHVAQAFKDLTLREWKTVAPYFKDPSVFVACAKKLNYHRKRALYPFFSRRKNGDDYLPTAVYGPPSKAAGIDSPLVLLNRKVPAKDKLHALRGEDFRDDLREAMGRTYWQRKWPQYHICPAGFIIDFAGVDLGRQETANLIHFMDEFRQIRVKNVISLKEAALIDSSIQGWFEEGRVK